MKIRLATTEDVDVVVKIHTLAFPRFFLTSLGAHFLKELYSGFLNHPNGVFLVAESNDTVVGFAAGTSDPAAFFRDIRRQRAIYFLVKAIPAVIHNPLIVMRKLYTALFYRGNSPVVLTKGKGALLSSIGVLPGVMGQAVGSQLLDKFEGVAFSHGADFVYLTTDETGNDRVNAFYRKSGYQEESRFIQQKNRPMLRYMKNLVR